MQDGLWIEEAKILTILNHPNIVKFICCNKFEETTRGYFIAMEQNGISLRSFIQMLKKGGSKLSLFPALDVILQIAYGMCYVHEHGIAHRDLKTSNVVVRHINAPQLEDYLEAKIVDFGISKSKLSQHESNTITRPNIGTTLYMPPEAFSNGRANWFKADVYSFSVMCSVILSGDEPFHNMKKMSDIRTAVCRGERPKIPTDTPNELASLIKEGWANDRDLRPSFLDICTRLEELRHHLLRKYSLNVSWDMDVQDYSSRYIQDMVKKRSKARKQEYSHSRVQRVVALLDEEEWFDGEEELTQQLEQDYFEQIHCLELKLQQLYLWNVSSMQSKLTPIHSKGGNVVGKMASGIQSITFGHYLIKGKSKHAMEDYWVAELKKLNDHELGLFAIYDGHMGHHVADYLQQNLFNNILSETIFWKDPELAIQYAYLNTDGIILENAPYLGPGGSTAVTAILVDSKTLYIANVGDSRAIISQSGIACQLSINHEPGNPIERSRIEDKGGFVTNMPGEVPRVDGQLAVSRSFGDKLLKVHINATPDIKVLEIHEEIELLILASDGLWKVMENQEAVDLVKDIKDPSVAAMYLAHEAVTRKSKDDISCIVVRFTI